MSLFFNPKSKEIKELKDELEHTRHQMQMLHEISNAMRTTLKLDQILYIILTALTSHEGLGFDRAILFLVNKDKNSLEGRMGIGPHGSEAADKIWGQMERTKLGLEKLLQLYDQFRSDPESELNKIVRKLRLPLEEGSGILAMTALEGMPFEVTDEDTKQRVSDDVQRALTAEYFVTMPLLAHDKVVGVILVDNVFTKRAITKSDMRLLGMFSNQAGLAIENSKLYEDTHRLAITDWATKLYNHGEFQHRLSRRIDEAIRSKEPISLIMLDIDNFKIYNDKMGHQKGDELIQRIGKLLRKNSRKGDIAARYGGEEFAVIMPGAEKDEARSIAERLHTEVKNMGLPTTISAGVASLPEDANNKEGLIKKADQALYKAKHTGKDRVC